jgi:hypothetical protein
MRPDILTAMKHAHDQYPIRLRLVKHDVAAMYDTAEAFRLQILSYDACERPIGQGSETLLQPVNIAFCLFPAPHAPRVAVNLLQVFVGASSPTVDGH